MLLTTYHARGSGLMDSAGRFPCSLANGEHLHHRCMRCKYEWAEAPFDAKAQPRYEGHWVEGLQ